MNRYLQLWENLENLEARPCFARNIVETDYHEFAARVVEQDPKFVSEIVPSLYAGDVYILKNGFGKQFMADLIDKTHHIMQTTPSSFHKMLNGCPDFHRIQDEEVAKKYIFESVRHSYYWFPWNSDPLGATNIGLERWRTFKFLGGYRFDEYEKNTPKDGVVDRFQIARYLPGLGRSETHRDAYQNQRVFISGFMSKRGVDYEKGGFYVVGPGNVKIDVENRIDVGDISIGYATIFHGVALVDPDKKPDWTKKDGRWWLGLYSNSSDHVAKRAVGKPVRIELKDQQEMA